MLATYFIKMVRTCDSEIKGVTQLKQPISKTEEVRSQLKSQESQSETLGF